MLSLFIGFALVAALGLGHHYGLLVVRETTKGSDNHPRRVVVLTFLGLLAIHTVEILAFAGAYKALLAWGGLGSFGGGFDESWSGLVYFSGINFATLGYTQIETSGPIRMINMMQSLGGFMVLTWSATFLYSVSARAWQK
ncbi:ion channel [Marinicauda sp. Alg238-R41]|uniref:ion channel n=1 Tax=Marinicauda sp. Alg238-R41 TaxID=2993447 RepID=UPI0022E8A5F4|nr:ion channel [Marinicauda sp. Alg238-R41]